MIAEYMDKISPNPLTTLIVISPKINPYLNQNKVLQENKSLNNTNIAIVYLIKVAKTGINCVADP